MQKILMIGNHEYKEEFIEHFQNKFILIEDKDNLLYCDRTIRVKHFFENSYDYVINFDTLSFDSKLLCNTILPNVRLFNFDLSKSNCKVITLYSYDDFLDENRDYGHLMDKLNENNIAINISNLYTKNLKDNSLFNHLCELRNFPVTPSKYNIELTSSISLNFFLEGLFKNIDNLAMNYKISICDMAYSIEQIYGLFEDKDLDELRKFEVDLTYQYGMILNSNNYLEILKRHIDNYFNKANNSPSSYLFFDGNRFIFQPQLLPPIESKFAIFYEDKYVI